MDGGVIGKRILVIFEDGEHVSRKEGVCTSSTDLEISIDNKHFIPRTRVVRVEVLE